MGRGPRVKSVGQFLLRFYPRRQREKRLFWRKACQRGQDKSLRGGRKLAQRKGLGTPGGLLQRRGIHPTLKGLLEREIHGKTGSLSICPTRRAKQVPAEGWF